jgi:WD40 repeat protein/tRNA A-37 threonylcarbamoyl transferase component Bud32
MSIPSESKPACASCGAEIPPDAPHGCCLKCLFVLGTAEQAGASQPLDQNLQPMPLGSLGDYELLEEIARGGMGIVYKARQKSLGRVVAVKMLLFGHRSGKDMAQRLRAEATAAASLQHPNIVAIHEVNEWDGQPFLVMDFIAGQNLNKLNAECEVRNGEWLRRAARYVKIVAEAIHYAHERGILHRDLKPSNVLIDGNDEPRVTDFGLARRLEGDSGLTMTGQVLGSPNYMPPEQATARRGKVDRRSDVYSLGAMLYHLLTGRPPFGGEALTDTLDQVLNSQPMSPRLLNPSVPRDLETICLKCLDKQPDKRYAIAQQLAEELDRFLQGEPIQARPVSAPERFWRWCQRKPATAASLATIALLLLIVLIGSPIALLRINRERKQAEHLLYFSNINFAQSAWEQNNIGLMRQLLDEIQSSPNRGFEWFYWQRQLHLATITLPTQTSDWAVSLSPDGLRLASAGRDPKVTLWDTTPGREPRELRTLAGHTGEVHSVAFSFDGKWVISGGADHTARIWETATGREIRKLVGHTREVVSLGFSRDGRRVLTGGGDNIVSVWDRESGEVLIKVAGDVCAFSPNEKQIVTGLSMAGENTAILWDATDGRELIRCDKRHTNDILCVAFAPDGSRVATGSGDRTARVWDASTGRELFSLGPHGHNVQAIAFSPNGQRIATASLDQIVRIWDANTGQPLFTLKGHAGGVEALAFFPDGRILTSGQDATIRIWDADGPRETLKLGGQDPGVWIWGIAFSPNGKRIVTGNSRSRGKVWDANTGQILKEIPAVSVVFSKDGRRFVTDHFDKTGWYAEIFDAESCRSLKKFPLQKEEDECVAFSPDGQRIATASQDKTARVWEVSTGNELLRITNHTDEVRGVVFSPDGQRILTASMDGTARIWDLASGKQLHCFPKHGLGLYSCAFSADGRRVVTGSADGTILLWEASTGRVIHTLKHSSTVGSLVFSPDGKRILSSAEDGTARLWDTASGRELLELKGHNGKIFRAVFSPDGRRIATGGNDGMAQIWESATEEQVAAWASEERKAK